MENGTLHIGGGSWGVPPSTNTCDTEWLGICKSGDPWYADKVVFTRYVIFLINFLFLFLFSHFIIIIIIIIGLGIFYMFVV